MAHMLARLLGVNMDSIKDILLADNWDTYTCYDHRQERK